MKDYNIFTLNNGIRVVHKQVSSTKILHCGIILDIGSRDENPEEYGIAHFWEHMAFKGTKRRKAYHIINSLDSVGGELNAYTTKEKICFYASVLDRFAERGIELLADITFDSIFPEKQIERERQVILEEMAMYEDSPEDAIQDEFDDLVFQNHSLGHNILGSSETIRSLGRNDFNDFISRNLDTTRVVVSFVGNISLKKIQRLAKKHLSSVPPTTAPQSRQPFLSYHPQNKVESKDIIQAHHGLGCPAYAVTDEKKTVFSMIVNLLGGSAMNSRLNFALREKLGYVYAVEANYLPLTDAGLFSIFFGTDAETLAKSRQVINREIKKLREEKLGTRQLHSLKEMIIGQLAMAEENNVSMMLMMGRSLLDLDEIISLDDVGKKVVQTDSLQILDIANEIFIDSNFSNLTFMPN